MKFKAEDFSEVSASGFPRSLRPFEAAKKAQDILDIHLATLTRVYSSYGTWGAEKSTEWEHTALLWGVAESRQKTCAHEAEILGYGTGNVVVRCKHCHLESKWEKA